MYHCSREAEKSIFAHSMTFWNRKKFCGTIQYSKAPLIKSTFFNHAVLSHRLFHYYQKIIQWFGWISHDPIMGQRQNPPAGNQTFSTQVVHGTSYTHTIAAPHIHSIILSHVGSLTFPLRLQKPGLLYSDHDHLQPVSNFEKIQIIFMSLISCIDLTINYSCKLSHGIVCNHRFNIPKPFLILQKYINSI